MIKKLENYKFSLEKILKALAKQDFNNAVDGIDSLINDIDYLLRNKEITKQERIDKDDFLKQYGTDGLQEDTNPYILMKAIDISDIESTKINNIYIRENGMLYEFDFESKRWICIEADPNY